MTDAKLQAIRERCEKATRGPWEDEYFDDGFPWVMLDEEVSIEDFDGDNAHGVCVFPDLKEHGTGNPADVAFVANARTDVPELLDEAKHYKAAVENLYRSASAFYEHGGCADEEKVRQFLREQLDTALKALGVDR